ncbi:hypothetical protein ACP4OV_022667 [Aristida adscensionis]
MNSFRLLKAKKEVKAFGESVEAPSVLGRAAGAGRPAAVTGRPDVEIIRLTTGTEISDKNGDLVRTSRPWGEAADTQMRRHSRNS